MIDKAVLLSYLPPFMNIETVTVPGQQTVEEIMDDLIEAHYDYASDYDKIYEFFLCDSLLNTCHYIFNFCKDNIKYKAESQNRQTSRSPAAILVLGDYTSGKNDCKHNAAFVGGLLDAINRNCNWSIDWNYRFASYDPMDETPAHVFVVVNIDGKETWVDPVLPRFNQRLQPYFYCDEYIKRKKMSVSRISGIEQITAGDTGALDDPAIAEALQSIDLSIDMPQDLQNAMLILMHYGVMNKEGLVDMDRYKSLITSLSQDESLQLQDSMYYISNLRPETVGNWFDDTFKFIQHNAAILGQQVPRAAFLGLVAINAFGYATKLNKALAIPEAHAKLADLWERLGGKFSVLESTIISGAKKKALLKLVDGKWVSGAAVGDGGASALIVAAATAVAIIIPVIYKILGKNNVPVNDIPLGADGLPLNTNTNPVMSFIQGNLPVVIGGVLLICYYLFFDNKKRA